MKQHVLGSFMIINALAGTFFFFMVSCSTFKPEPAPLAPVYHPAEVISVHFERPLLIDTPQKDPVTVEEYIRCGLFYFEQGRFAEAAGAFETAKEKLDEPGASLFRSCLVSEAVCHLLADNRPGFLKTIKEIRSTYTAFELMVVEQQDPKMKTLFWLSREFSGNDGGVK